MITDFPEAKKEMKKALDSVLRTKVKQNAPMLSMAGGKTLHEGDSMGVIHEWEMGIRPLKFKYLWCSLWSRVTNSLRS